MYLIGVGTGHDPIVTESVNMICIATNISPTELHNKQRLEICDIALLLSDSKYSVVVFICHGSDTALLDATTSRNAYLNGNNHSILSGKAVFAHACNTGLNLGRDIVKSAMLYLGFDAPISGPVDRKSVCYPYLRDIYVMMLTFINSVEGIPESSRVDVSQSFLDDLRALSIEIQNIFDINGLSRLDAEELITLSQFGRDATIWVHNCATVLKAQGAPPRASLW